MLFKTKNKTLKAFTLAEILITLSIIGVVAALTIPTLIQRTGNEEAVSRLMKAYSTLSQATEMLITEKGSPSTWALDVDSLYKAYKEHLRNAKDCGSTSGCFKQQSEHGYKYLHGKSYDNTNWNQAGKFRSIILSDGVQIIFQGTNYIGIDINGEKEPNTWGRDVYEFHLTSKGLIPGGCSKTEETSNCKTDSYGYDCACKVIAEGAMNY